MAGTREGLVNWRGWVESIRVKDPEIYKAIEGELERERKSIILIASENYAPPEVLEAQGCVLTNKYAEGYPGRRYYGGCRFVDQVEEIAIERAKKLFGAEHANVQPHSGTSANMAVYFAVLKPGDKILAMDLAHGGHLSHGSPVNFSGRMYEIHTYGVDRETERIPMNRVREIALKVKPRMIVAGASSYPMIIDFKAFREIADEVGAYLMVDMAHFAGLVAGGVYPSPVPYADFVTFTTHKTLMGPRGGVVLCKRDYAEVIDKTVFPGIQGGPLMHVIAAKAICFKNAMEEWFKRYSKGIVENSIALASFMRDRGYRLVAGGTETHLFLVDLRNVGITGKEAEARLEEAGIVVNKNMIPFDPYPPAVTSGIRIGTPAVTARGMGKDEMKKVADFMDRVLKGEDPKRVKKEVEAFLEGYPVYANR